MFFSSMKRANIWPQEIRGFGSGVGSGGKIGGAASVTGSSTTPAAIGGCANAEALSSAAQSVRLGSVSFGAAVFGGRR
jgi:hypothetical protein